MFFLSLDILIFFVTAIWAFLAMNQSSSYFTFETFNPLTSPWENKEKCIEGAGDEG